MAAVRDDPGGAHLRLGQGVQLAAVGGPEEGDAEDDRQRFGSALEGDVVHELPVLALLDEGEHHHVVAARLVLGQPPDDLDTGVLVGGLAVRQHRHQLGAVAAVGAAPAEVLDGVAQEGAVAAVALQVRNVQRQAFELLLPEQLQLEGLRRGVDVAALGEALESTMLVVAHALTCSPC